MKRFMIKWLRLLGKRGQIRKQKEIEILIGMGV